MTMGPFGTHLNRNSVWAEQAVGWNMYNARCAYLLQQGHYVADILYIKMKVYLLVSLIMIQPAL